MKKWILALVGATTVACGGGTLGDCPSGSDATQTEGRMLVVQQCANCHSSMLVGAARADAPADVNFDTAAGAQAQIDSAWEQTESAKMPPAAKLTAEQIEKIRVYLACGASK